MSKIFDLPKVMNAERGIKLTAKHLREYTEQLCNLYFFSGIVFPATSPNIRYEYDEDFGTWQKMQGSGPYFQATESVQSFEAESVAFPLERPSPELCPPSASDLDLFVTPPETTLLRRDARIESLQRDTWKFLRVELESRASNLSSSRFLPTASSEVYAVERGLGNSNAVDPASTNFGIFQLNFGYTSLVSEEVSVTDAVSISSFVADIMNALEVVLGLSLFSVLLRSLSMSLKWRDR